MKLTFNREEVRALRELATALDSIQGFTAPIAFKDFTITKRAYVASMVTGRLTIDVTPEAVVELSNMIEGLTVEVAPFIKSIINLLQGLEPLFARHDKKFTDFFERMNEDINPEPPTPTQGIWSEPEVISCETITGADLKEAV